MLDKKDITLGLALVTGRARSAAKALSIVAENMTRSRMPGDDPKLLSLRIEHDQLEAFQYLVDSVLTLTTEAAEVVVALTKVTRDDPDTKIAGRKFDDEDFGLKPR